MTAMGGVHVSAARVAILAAAVLLLAPGSVQADAASSAHAGARLSLVSGDLEFPRPAHAVSGAEASGAWTVNATSAAPAEGPLPPDFGFHLSGQRVFAWYAQRVIVPGSGLPWDPHARANEPFLVSGPVVPFENHAVRLLTGQRARELFVAGLGKEPLPISAESAWDIRTLAPGEQRAEAPPRMSPKLLPTPVPGRWEMLLEGTGTRLTTDAASHVYVYGFNVTIEHRLGTQAYRTGRWQEEGHGATVGVKVFREAYLVLYPQNSTLSLAPGDRPVRIRAPTVALDGQFTFPEAHGTLRLGGESREFAADSCDLRGALRLTAVPRTPFAKETRDRVEVAGLAESFETASDEAVATSASRTAAFPVVLAALGLAALLAVLAKGLASLFTRIESDQVLAHGRRRALYDLIVANPGISRPDLARATQASISSVEHNLRALRHHGKIRPFKMAGAWRFVAANHDLAAARRQLTLASDPSLAVLLRLLQDRNETPATDALERLRCTAGLSLSGGWSLIRRGIRAGLVEKERRGRYVFLREPARAARPGPSS